MNKPMKKLRMLLVPAMLCTLWTQQGWAADLGPVGGADQSLVQSYDLEAAGKLKEALAAMDQTPPARKDS